MKRREFIKQSAGAVIAASLVQGVGLQAKSTGRKPNLLFITVDDMNWSMPGFMGNELNLTPRLDALAARSHRFVHNRGAAPICQPSREAMMTGRVPHRSGGLGFNPIHEGVPTMTTVLKEVGYYTVGIHKLDHMAPLSCFPWDYAVPGKGRAPSEYATAVREGILRAREQQKPFFISCNLNDPHRPFYGSEAADKVDHHELGEYKVAHELTADDVKAPIILEDLPEIRKEYAQYCNSAQRMDISIGKVLDVLAAEPEMEDTIIFFSADHGMPFPFSKATAYDWGSRTPALLCYPGMGAPRIFNERTCNIDYMPTLLELIGVKAPSGMDGKSWMSLIHGGKMTRGPYVFTHVNGVASGAQYPMRAIQDDRYSLVFMPWSDGVFAFKVESMAGLTFAAMRKAAETDQRVAKRLHQYIYGIPLAFYDLKEDPAQRVNLIEDAKHKGQIEKMKSELLAYMKRTDDPQLKNFECYLAGEKMTVEQPAKLAGAPSD